MGRLYDWLILGSLIGILLCILVWPEAFQDVDPQVFNVMLWVN